MKAKIVFDMPDDCTDCLLRFNWFCRITKKDIPFNLDSRPDWCPLEPFETIGDYLKGEE